MNKRRLGKTGWQVSEISFGAWAIGADWGQVDDRESLAALHEALELGVNFIDTADVYGDGHSERLIAQALRDRGNREEVIVATKAGRRLQPHVAEGYTPAALTRFVERSLRNLGVEALPLLQLHCPPTDVYYRPELWEALERLKEAGKLRHYGVSVEKVEEGLKAIEYSGVATVQIIFNLFRQRPSELFFREAQRRDVGIIVRVPLASGLLTGKMSRDSHFPPSDHRNYNREGEAFDVGETFAGMEFERGLQAVEALRTLLPADASLTQFALRWILMWDAVSCTIPGAKRPAQVRDNVAAAQLPPLTPEQMAAARAIYEQYARPLVHHRW